MAEKNKKFQIRLSKEELELWKEKANKYDSFSEMVRIAVNKLDDRMAISKIDLGQSIIKCYEQHNYEMNKIGANLNQIAKHINILALSRDLQSIDLEEKLLPIINSIYDLLYELKKEQKRLLNKSFN